MKVRASLAEQPAAAAELKVLEAIINDAHFVSLHGPETTLIQQELRAKTGKTSENQSKRPIDVSRWVSYQDMPEAFQKAQAIYRKTGQSSVTVDLGRVIWEGYLKGGGSYLQTTKAVVRFDIDGKPYTAYPKLR